jgi:hypothetical protein
MFRLVAGVVAGVITWGVIVTVLNLGLRHGFPGYAGVEKAMAFTVPMMAARLSISAISSVLSGYLAAAIDGEMWAPIVAGTILLLIFIPIHYPLWEKFPLWYHLTFLTSLLVLSALGGLVRGRQLSAA